MIDGLTGDAEGMALLRTLRPLGFSISIITYVEVFEGIVGSRNRAQAEQSFRAFLRGTPVLGIDRAVAERAATIRADLRRQRRPITDRAMDLLIAATAAGCAIDVTLVSRGASDGDDVCGSRFLPETSAAAGWLLGSRVR